jgi:hypothetical protein
MSDDPNVFETESCERDTAPPAALMLAAIEADQ